MLIVYKNDALRMVRFVKTYWVQFMPKRLWFSIPSTQPTSPKEYTSSHQKISSRFGHVNVLICVSVYPLACLLVSSLLLFVYLSLFKSYCLRVIRTPAYSLVCKPFCLSVFPLPKRLLINALLYAGSSFYIYCSLCLSASYPAVRSTPLWLCTRQCSFFGCPSLRLFVHFHATYLSVLEILCILKPGIKSWNISIKFQRSR